MSVFDDTVLLEFDEYPDLQVRMRVSIPLRKYLDVVATFDDSDDRFTPDEWLRQIAAIVDEYRVDWTLEGDALDQPGNLVIGICRSWLRAVSQVPSPLARRYGATTPYQEPSTNPPTSAEPATSEDS